MHVHEITSHYGGTSIIRKPLYQGHYTLVLSSVYSNKISKGSFTVVFHDPFQAYHMPITLGKMKVITCVVISTIFIVVLWELIGFGLQL